MKWIGLIMSVWLLSSQLSAQQSDIDLQYCHISNLSEEVLCGSYQVEENRTQPSGRKLDIKISVIPAVSETKETDPVVLLAGGPGQGARAMGQFVNRAFNELNETRDIVLIDQRGMGDSNPLDCAVPESNFDELTAAQAQEVFDELLKDCLENLEADVTQYTQDIANQDIHEILNALGYQKVNLYGVSWGTRSALLYANQFPEQVRTVTVDGTAPLSNTVPLFFTRDAQKTINLLLQDCKKDNQCNTRFPDIGNRFDAFLMDFPETGISTQIADPNTGKMTPVIINKDAIISSVRTILYSPDLSRMLPLIIDRLIAEDFRPLAGLMSAVGDAGMTLGTTLTILCSEELSRFSENDIKASGQEGFEQATFASMINRACDLWPKAPLPALYNQQLVQQIPTLIMSGALDPVTPPYWGDEMKKHFPNSAHLIAPNTGHNVAPVGCASELMADFVKAADFEELDGTCLDSIKRPSFFLNSSGPVARSDS